MDWRTVECAPDYLVSRGGEIVGKRGYVLRQRVHPTGYRVITLLAEHGQTTVRVNRVVARAFHGPPPNESDDAMHLNGEKLDNRASNLRWGTRRVNVWQRRYHLTLPCPVVVVLAMRERRRWLLARDCYKRRRRLQRKLKRRRRINVFGVERRWYVGERNPACKITDSEAKQIRDLYRDSRVSMKKIGAQFGVSGMQVSRIVRGIHRAAGTGIAERGVAG